jgi:hypothetical protein
MLLEEKTKKAIITYTLCFPSLPHSHSLYVVGGKNKKGNDFSPPLVFHFELLWQQIAEGIKL